jgi:hypothetical protein
MTHKHVLPFLENVCLFYEKEKPVGELKNIEKQRKAIWLNRTSSKQSLTISIGDSNCKYIY